MRKISCLFFLLTLIILFIISCSTQEAVKGTVWKGEIDGLDKNYPVSSVKDKGDFDCYFNRDNTMKAYITYKYEDGKDYVIDLEGEYTIDNNNNINAELEGEDYLDEKIFLELEGNINNITGSGSGNYQLKIKDSFDLWEGGSYLKMKGDWNVSRVKSY